MMHAIRFPAGSSAPIPEPFTLAGKATMIAHGVSVRVRIASSLRCGSFFMKVTVNVECTPDEARTFLGLPDVKPMQEALMQELEQRLRANIHAMDPEGIMRTWLPASLQGAEQIQKMFWAQIQQTMSGVANVTGSMIGNLGDRKARE